MSYACDWCGKEFVEKGGPADYKFCCEGCMLEFRKDCYNWGGGPPRTYTQHQELRKWLDSKGMK